MTGARLAQVICGVASILLGVAAMGLSAAPWLNLEPIGMAPIKPTGIGWNYVDTYYGFGLGWAVIIAGLMMILGGVLALIGMRTGPIVASGAGFATVLIAGTAVLARGRLIMDLEQLGASSADFADVAIAPALLLLIVVGIVVAGAGAVVALADDSRPRLVAALVGAWGVGLLFAVVAVVVAWWAFTSRGVVDYR